MPPSDPGPNGDDRDVLTSLPRTRPARRSAKRDRPVRGATAPAAPAAAAASDTPARAKAKAKAAAEPKPTATSSAQRPKAAGTTRAARKAKPAAARTKPATANRSTARRRPARSSAPTASAAAASERAAEPAVPPAGYATSPPEHRGPDPFAVVSTAVQAAGEIAQIGATLWSQAVRSAIDRLPKP